MLVDSGQINKFQVKELLIKENKIYTDGACTGNPGPGGWAAVILLENKKKELFGGEKLTTNNRMELTAAIKGLEYCDLQEKKQLTLKEKILTCSFGGFLTIYIVLNSMIFLFKR